MKSSLYLRQIEVGPMANFVYLVGDPNTKEAMIVDPGWEAEKILKQASEDDYKVKGVLITHTHFDHIGALGDVLEKVDSAVYVHSDEADYLKGLKSNLRKTSAGDKIKIGNVEAVVIHTPGHTKGSQCFLIQNNLVSGDTLFINACGRCDLPGSSPEEMYYSLKRLSELDESTVLYPGHNYADETASTIGQEKKLNPYFQPTNVRDFLHYRMGY